MSKNLSNVLYGVFGYAAATMWDELSLLWYILLVVVGAICLGILDNVLSN